MKLPADREQLLPQLRSYVEMRQAEIDLIDPRRRRALQAMAQYVLEAGEAEGLARLTFICTHNSRRSQIAQIWAQTAAAVFGVKRILTFSGGTEVTAFHPNAVQALARSGFHIEPDQDGENPAYSVGYAEGVSPVRCFSKVYNDPSNPASGFCAVMTCSQADEACPVVVGALARISLPYEDPKTYDGTARETLEYDERCAEIAREMLYAFSGISALAQES